MTVKGITVLALIMLQSFSCEEVHGEGEISVDNSRNGSSLGEGQEEETITTSNGGESIQIQRHYLKPDNSRELFIKDADSENITNHLNEEDNVGNETDENSTRLIVVQNLNKTAQNQNETSENSTIKRVVCITTNATNTTLSEEPVVQLLNNTEFQARLLEEYNSSVSNRSGPAHCSITLFYAPWCPFSADAAPHFNALARHFPDIKMYAMDSSMYHSLNTQYGVMALPSVLLFHNSRPLYKYNYTEYSLEKYAEFVTILTGIKPVNKTQQLLPQDYIGPVPTEAVVGRNYYLLLAYVFSLLCGLVQFSKSPLCERMIDTVRNAWQEAEIQHEHAD